MPYIHEYYSENGDKEFLVFAFEDGTVVDIDARQWNGETSIHFKREDVKRLVADLQLWLDKT